MMAKYQARGPVDIDPQHIRLSNPWPSAGSIDRLGPIEHGLDTPADPARGFRLLSPNRLKHLEHKLATILTAARTGETIGAKWDEIDLSSKVWTILADRMKARREHRVPLAPAAVAILEKAAERRENDYVFPGARGGGLSNMSFLMLLRRMGRGDLTAHGFRSTFRDWAAERTGFPREVAEQALAQALPDKVEAAYRRSDLFDKRRRLMEAWARFCSTPTKEERSVVTSIRASA
jgi:integrase